jgi:hypothetical protein
MLVKGDKKDVILRAINGDDIGSSFYQKGDLQETGGGLPLHLNARGGSCSMKVQRGLYFIMERAFYFRHHCH